MLEHNDPGDKVTVPPTSLQTTNATTVAPWVILGGSATSHRPLFPEAGVAEDPIQDILPDVVGTGNSMDQPVPLLFRLIVESMMCTRTNAHR